MPLSKICCHGAIPVSTFISGTKFLPSLCPSGYDQASLGNLARYIIRACFSQERMVYISAQNSDDGISKVVYTSKDRKSRKVFNALDWLASLVTHIPGRYEQTVRYYGHYSNKSRGLRKKAGTDDTIPTVIPNEMSSKEFRRNWARLIQKIYEVNPLTYPKCQGPMRIISFIEELDIIERILRHLGLWDIRNHDPPKSTISDSQIPAGGWQYSTNCRVEPWRL